MSNQMLRTPFETRLDKILSSLVLRSNLTSPLTESQTKSTCPFDPGSI
jgi:hypothetical protein